MPKTREKKRGSQPHSGSHWLVSASNQGWNLCGGEVQYLGISMDVLYLNNLKR